MEAIFEKFHQKLHFINTNFVRGLLYQINWNARLIGIKGARGIGKTTLMLQYIKIYLANDLDSTLYVSLDNIWFSEYKLSHLVDYFVKRGGKYLFLDEVHKYPNWSQELKNMYDDYPQLKIVFTGSSLLEILNARADLSRRAIVYKMQGLSFREYLNLNLSCNFEVLNLKEILEKHTEISQSIVNKIKPLKHFSEYIKNGYFPFYNELPSLYYTRLEEIINMTLEIELPMLRGIDITFTNKVKQMLLIIAESVPFIPNISKLSERIGLNRGTFLNYLHYLQEADITLNIYKDASGISKLQKPDKLFLENTNYIYALAPENTNTGNLRETFFVNQIKSIHKIEYAEHGDFIINKKYNFEIGGSKKNNKQLKELNNSFIAADEIEFGFNNKIPLWMFGFLY